MARRNILTWLRTGQSRFKTRQRQQIFLAPKVSKPALRSTPAVIQCVQEAILTGVERGGVKSNSSVHLILTLKMRGAIPPPHHTSF